MAAQAEPALVRRPAGDSGAVAAGTLDRLDRSGSAGRRSLLLVWSAGAAAASFSPTPYGLGVVEIALIVALRGLGSGHPMRSGQSCCIALSPSRSR